MITLENVCVTIDGKQVLKNISCTIEPGDFIIILGPNGAGKSTLFDVISGKRRIDSGKILFNNSDITNLSERQRAPFIAQLSQNPLQNCAPAMSVEENLALASLKGKVATLSNALSRTNISRKDDQPINLQNPQLLKTPMGFLSGGQRQMIAFIMGTLKKPELLLLDEPTAALDPNASIQLLRFANNLIKKQQLTSLLITHHTKLAELIGNKVWILENGKISKRFNKSQEDFAQEKAFPGTNFEEMLRDHNETK